MIPDYDRRLNRIAQTLPADSLLCIQAPAESIRNRDVAYPFRSCSDMLYLTGLNEPEITFLVNDKGERWLIFPEKSYDEIRWTGPVTPLHEVKKRLNLSKKLSIRQAESSSW